MPTLIFSLKGNVPFSRRFAYTYLHFFPTARPYSLAAGAERSPAQRSGGGATHPTLSSGALFNVVGFYTTGDRMKYWGKMGAFWSGLWGLLAGAAFLIIPGVGPVVAAGPVTGWIIGALEGAIFVGGVSVLGSGLVSIGIPRDSVLKYESSVKAGKFLLMLHGTAAEAEKLRRVLDTTEAKTIDIHRLPTVPARVA